MQHTQESRPILASYCSDLRFGDTLLEWVAQLLQDRRNFGIHALLKPVPWVNSMIQKLEDVVEVLLGGRSKRVLTQRMFHLQLKVIVRQVFEELLSNSSLE
ncbi:hypothetical protein MFS transporter [Aspergillus fumigatus]|nr:hypothetical protein MFS transporter [Aspergillus fumigatus]